MQGLQGKLHDDGDQALTEALIQTALNTGQSIDDLYRQFLEGKMLTRSQDAELACRAEREPVRPT